MIAAEQVGIKANCHSNLCSSKKFNSNGRAEMADMSIVIYYNQN